MSAAAIRELIEDAFLACLEDGANPPQSFALCLPVPERFTLKVAGYVVEVVPE